MSRLSREQKRELKRQRSTAGAGEQPATGMTPIEVHVPASADSAARAAVPGAAGAPSCATVDGTPVVAAPGETVQGAILNRLHRLALASGHPVLASIHDERIGFVVPLQVHVDGSSRYTAEPVRVAPPAPPAPPVQPYEQRPDLRPHLPAQEHRHSPAEGHSQPPARNFSEPPVQERRPRPPAGEVPRSSAQEHPRSGGGEHPRSPVQEHPQHSLRDLDLPQPLVQGVPQSPVQAPQPPAQRRPQPPTPPLPPVPASAERSVRAPEAPGAPRRDRATYALRAVPEPKPLPGTASTHVLRAVPESASPTTPAPAGQFGPAPLTGAAPEPTPASDRMSAPGPEAAVPERAPAHGPEAAASERKSASAMEALSLLAPEPEPEPKPAPLRGFDAVAEAVLAPSPQEPAPERDAASAFLAEPVARINEAVKTGRIEEAAGMAERAVAEAAQSLGQEHPEVLKLRELTAYIAYLAGDALRSFHLSLDLARVRRRHRDTRAAYGNVQSAAAAWRAVRDPLQGLHLGRDLIGVWTELTADDGPAADDLEQLESARTRMGRLAERAHVVVDNPYTWTPRAQGE
ncbi:hypothetical protein [Streptomyces rhizosphaerihabitans]|uniref:hypothetical protein n=1 Tax=Streptomyces rhizosphaerihabitans TaxID=1266770 RepID=UPI0021C0A9FF|nr:hypothetical protein [Streptomyces rhizosphaerihabitans]MCT9006571.1 hypothetical protein [Streptomyces rhizosphaerihabitans]